MGWILEQVSMCSTKGGAKATSSSYTYVWSLIPILIELRGSGLRLKYSYADLQVDVRDDMM